MQSRVKREYITGPPRRAALCRPAAEITCDGDHVGSLSARENTNSSYFLHLPLFFSSACVCFSPRSVTLQLMICNRGMEAVKLSLILTPAASAVCFFKKKKMHLHIFFCFPPFFYFFHGAKRVDRHPQRPAWASGSPHQPLRCRVTRRLSDTTESWKLSRCRGLAGFTQRQTSDRPRRSLSRKKHSALTALNMNQPLRCLGLLAEVDFSLFFPHHQLLVVSL